MAGAFHWAMRLRNIRGPGRIAVYVGIYVFSAAVWFAIGSIGTDRDRDLGARLARNGVVTTAIVTRSTPEDHNTICFDYVAAGTTYKGCDFARFDKNARELPVGSQTRVTYDVSDPTVYCACPAESLVSNAREAPLVAALWMGTGTWLIIMINARRMARA
jgi:hypothetical protein